MIVNLKRMTAIFMAVFFVSAAHGQEKETVSSLSLNVGGHSVKLDNSQSRGGYFDIAATLHEIMPNGVMYGVDFINGYTSAHWKDDGSLSSISLEVRPIITVAVLPHIGFALTKDTMAFASIGSQVTVLRFDGQVGATSYDDVSFVNSWVFGGGIVIKDIGLFGSDTTDGKYIVRFDYRFAAKTDGRFELRRNVNTPYEYGDSHLFTMGIGWRVR